MVNLPEDVRTLYPWTGHRLDVDGGAMHYLDEGPRDGEVLLAVHGNPTWSFYWRSLVASFSDRYRVVVPDHIGCGLSDKPRDWPYQLAGHRDNIGRLVSHLGLKNITLVVHDWGGAIGMGFATKNPELVSRLVITNTAAFRSTAIPPSIAMCRIPGLGAFLVRGLNGFGRVALIRAAKTRLPAAVKRGLLLPYDSWGNRIAHHRFVQDIPLKPDHPSYAALAEEEAGLAGLTDRPMLICWGDDDFCFSPEFRKEWQQRFPDAEVHAWPEVGHYVMEDAGERVNTLISEFLEKHPLG